MSNTKGITLSGTQVDLIGQAVILMIEAAKQQSPSLKRTMPLKAQRKIFAAAQMIAAELEDASSARRRLEYIINHPDEAIDIQLMWGYEREDN